MGSTICRLSGTVPDVVIQSAHRDPYDHAITIVGLRLTEIGYPYSTRAHELARELDDTVSRRAPFRIGGNGDMLPLRSSQTSPHGRCSGDRRRRGFGAAPGTPSAAV